MEKHGRALIVLSGGQDSATCLAMARNTHAKVFAIAFNYGQRHVVELECAAALCQTWGVKLRVVDIVALRGLVSSALIDGGDVTAKHPRLRSVPASFVPARNALFLTLAHAAAQELECEFVYTGVCHTDYSGYPDCRPVFVSALNAALNVGYESTIRFVTPLMEKTKGETFAIAHDLGVLEQIINMTHTCYNGDHETRHVWGYGCGKCPSCNLRANGYADFLSMIGVR